MKIQYIFILLIFLSSCIKKYENYCSNEDATNYHPKANEGHCIFSSDLIIGAYRFTVVDYPLQPSQEGETYTFDIREPYCYGTKESYKYVQFFTLQSPFEPSDFCLLIEDYDFEFTEEMHISWFGSKLTGKGNFDKNGNFNFSGTLHRLDNSEYPIILKSSK